MTSDENVRTLPILSDREQTKRSKSILYIEAKLHDDARDDGYADLDQIKLQLRKWILQTYLSVRVGEQLRDTTSLACRAFLQCCKVSGHSRLTSDARHKIADNELEISVYTLFTARGHETFDESTDSELPSYSELSLPHKDFDGHWETLVYDEPLPESILRLLTRMMRIFSNSTFQSSEICWHNLILLYGPPGTGKTSLARALAQKLSIRMLQFYPTARFLEVNCHTLLSKWFGESSKQVGRLFDDIISFSSDPSALTIVLIDEVETLASSREIASQSNDCSDVIRSTNELLQGLDKLQNCSNVVLICTSNLKDNMDLAFIDRCRIKKSVGMPNIDCIYEILHSAINDLITKELVYFDRSELKVIMAEKDIETVPNNAPTSKENADTNNDLRNTPACPDHNLYNPYIPDLDWVIGNLSHGEGPSTSPMQLRKLSRTAMGLSARTLRALPITALAEYTIDEPCDFRVLLPALEKKIKEEHSVHIRSDAPAKSDTSAGEEDLVRIDDSTWAGFAG